MAVCVQSRGARAVSAHGAEMECGLIVDRRVSSQVRAGPLPHYMGQRQSDILRLPRYSPKEMPRPGHGGMFAFLSLRHGGSGLDGIVAMQMGDWVVDTARHLPNCTFVSTSRILFDREKPPQLSSPIH